MIQKLFNFNIPHRNLKYIFGIYLIIFIACLILLPLFHNRNVLNEMRNQIQNNTQLLKTAIVGILESEDYNQIKNFSQWAKGNKNLAYYFVLDDKNEVYMQYNPYNVWIDYQKKASAMDIMVEDSIMSYALPVVFLVKTAFYGGEIGGRKKFGYAVIGMDLGALDRETDKMRITLLLIFSFLFIAIVSILVVLNTNFLEKIHKTRTLINQFTEKKQFKEKIESHEDEEFNQLIHSVNELAGQMHSELQYTGQLNNAEKIVILCQKYHITEREKEILLLVIEGKNESQIGASLFISSSTVRRHMYNIYQKMDVNNRISLVKKILAE